MRQQCDGKILLSSCCHAYKLFVCQAIKCIRDNMTTKKIFFLGGEMYDTLSTLSVRRRRRRSSHGPHLHGFPLAPLGYHPRLSMVRLRRRRLCVKVGEAESEEYPQDHTRCARVEIGDMRERFRKAIHEAREWKSTI